MDSHGMDFNGEHRASSPVPAEDLVDWLCSLHLPQYVALFARAGLRSLGELRGLTAERLQEVADFPTGHRRRILRSLEALGLDKLQQEEKWAESGVAKAEAPEEKEEVRAARTLGPSRRKPVPRPRNVFLKDRKRGATSLRQTQASQAGSTAGMEAGSTRTLPAKSRAHGDHKLQPSSPPDTFSSAPSFLAVPPLPPRELSRSTSPGSISGSTTHSSCSSSNESLSISLHSLPSDLDNVLEEPAPFCLVSAPRSPQSAPSSLLDIPPSAQTDTQIPLDNVQEDFLMVENDIYEMDPMPHPPSKPSGPRNTRSYRLRHRPVPQLPDQGFTPKYDR